MEHIAGSLLAFRARFPYRPWQKIVHEGAVVELVSYPWPVGSWDSSVARVMARLTPGDPTSMAEITL